jgi:hypothetical protein
MVCARGTVRSSRGAAPRQQVRGVAAGVAEVGAEAAEAEEAGYGPEVHAAAAAHPLCASIFARILEA